MYMWEHITTEGVGVAIAVLVAILGGNAWVTAALIDRRLAALNRLYIRKDECVLRSGGNRDMIVNDREEMKAECLAAAGRDAVTQARIDELVRAIASRAAETILRDREILSKIDALLLRK
jgi:hypothetical protein